MNNTDALISHHLEIAGKIALDEVRRLATNVIKRNKNIGQFYMAMGTYFFEDLAGNILYDYEDKKLNNFIGNWDRELYLTNNQMQIFRKDVV